jgi:hypothetical protein
VVRIRSRGNQEAINRRINEHSRLKLKSFSMAACTRSSGVIRGDIRGHQRSSEVINSHQRSSALACSRWISMAACARSMLIMR